MKLAIIGCGYLGITLGSCMAEIGHNVMMHDIDTAKIENLKNGQLPLFEPGLEDMLKKNLLEGKINFSSELKIAINDAEIIFLALPTPANTNGSANLDALFKVSNNLAELIKEGAVIVNKCTVPVGTAEKIEEEIKNKTAVNFKLISNPEFLREGKAIYELLNENRIVIGCDEEWAIQKLKDCYEKIIKKGVKVLVMDHKAAELTKCAANAFLATKISFINEIANYCELAGVDIEMIKAGIGSDSRIGEKYLSAGIGYGGGCLAKDISALDRAGESLGYNFELLKATISVNNKQINHILKKVLKYHAGNLNGKNLAIWGLAFKAETDDIREAPSIRIIEKLLAAGANIVTYDPKAMENVKKIFGEKIKYVNSPIEASKNADGLLILNEWDCFLEADLSELKNNLKIPVVFDGRNLLNAQKARIAGLIYFGMGK